jgi:hypothetical protein
MMSPGCFAFACAFTPIRLPMIGLDGFAIFVPDHLTLERHFGEGHG